MALSLEDTKWPLGGKWTTIETFPSWKGQLFTFSGTDTYSGDGLVFSTCRASYQHYCSRTTRIPDPHTENSILNI